MSKISFDELYMDLAQNLATKSHCVKKKVGAVISKDTRIISLGYNGPPAGTHNCDEEWPVDGCARDRKGGCSLALHAEANAILYAAKNQITLEHATLYVTLAPCLPCARIIYTTGIKKVIFRDSYAAYKGIEIEEGVDFLRRFGVEVSHFPKEEKNKMNESSSNRIFIIPIVVGLALAAGIYIGTTLSPAPKISSDNKLNSILDYIQQEYVDTINREKLTNETIVKLLEQLDPHSAYIPKEELKAANEPLEGNFEGIGIEFHIQEDTIMVVSALSGGPSETLGIKPGDRIVKVDKKLVAGINITNEMVMKSLRGAGGSIVNVSIFRRGQAKLIDYKIVRGRIPINSLEFTYMITPQTGYIKISRFSATTYDEFILAMQRLKKEGLRNLILDLRGNPGGFLDAATSISDEFIGGKKLIVYTEGKSRPKTEYFTSHDGLFEQGKLIILIDEGSASAAEIVSGAIQDWDRGTLVGRRSFGKGLVQEQTLLPDGSAIRLTIARYYTPTGRSIQKPYDHGFSAYEDELYDRLKNGELLNQDSIHQTDTIVFKTPSGKTVYGGGGITPDVFVPLDTLYNSEYINRLFASGSVNQFAYDYVDQNRATLMKYETAQEFKEKFKSDAAFIQEFISYSEKKGVVKNDKDLQKSMPLLQVQLKAYIARLLWKNEGMYPILHERDVTLQKALQLLQQPMK